MHFGDLEEWIMRGDEMAALRSSDRWRSRRAYHDQQASDRSCRATLLLGPLGPAREAEAGKYVHLLHRMEPGLKILAASDVLDLSLETHDDDCGGLSHLEVKCRREVATVRGNIVTTHYKATRYYISAQDMPGRALIYSSRQVKSGTRSVTVRVSGGNAEDESASVRQRERYYGSLRELAPFSADVCATMQASLDNATRLPRSWTPNRSV